MTVRVKQFARKPYPGAFSIERVFADVNAALPQDIAVECIENRNFSHGVLPRLRDALRARRLAGPVNHVVGDVHYLTCFLPRQRTILTIHDCEMVTRASGLKRWLLRVFWLDLPVRCAGHVVAISEQTRHEVAELSGIAASRIRVIEDPVSAIFRPAPPPEPDGMPTVLHIGTNPNKNLERLIEAVQGLPLRLLIVGPLSQEQTDLLSRSGIDHENRSNLSDAEILTCYEEADVLAFVSLSEGFGLPILEAQAVGRPVLTSDREPMRSVAGSGAALFVNPEDVADMRAGLERLMSEPGLCDTLVSAGQSNVERFRPESIADRYADLYREVAHG